MISKADAKIVAEFLEANYKAFQEHLKEKMIEPSEAEMIIIDLCDLRVKG